MAFFALAMAVCLPGTIGFVGEDLLDTRDDPEFWTQATLIDVGYGAAQDGLFTSTYAQPMSRIKWQITEELLIGRIAYERIDGSDGRGLGGPTQDGEAGGDSGGRESP